MFRMLPAKSWSIRSRLTAWYALSSLLILVVAGTVAFYAFRGTLINQTDRSLTIRGMEIISSAVGSELYRRGGLFVVPPTNTSNVVVNFNAEFQTDSISAVGDPIYMRLMHTTPYQVILLSHNVKQHDLVERSLGLKQLLSPTETVSSYFTGTDDFSRLRVVDIRVPRQPFVLQLATPWQRDEDTLAPVINGIIAIVLVGFALSALGGWLLVGSTLRPIIEIVTEAEKTRGNQLEPSFVAARTTADDEIGHLASALNAMMARVHSALSSQRQFTADASHDLRTPLAIIRGEIELALARERSVTEYRSVLESALQETDRLIRIVVDLGDLARADVEDEIPVRKKEVDAIDLCRRVIKFHSRQAEHKDIRLRMDGMEKNEVVLIYADEMAIERALDNLVDNAISYNVPGGHVALTVTEKEDLVRITISDSGQGINAAAIPHIFDRFYRGDKSRTSSDTTGINHSGLGLAIVKSIITSNGGEISVRSVIDQGTDFTVTLPKFVA